VLPFATTDHINRTIANKLFDYMGAGKPVIVSEAPPMVRIVNQEKCGIVADCQTHESIAMAIAGLDGHDCHCLGENGMRAAKSKYNWSIDSANMVKFIERFI